MNTRPLYDPHRSKSTEKTFFHQLRTALAETSRRSDERSKRRDHTLVTLSPPPGGREEARDTLLKERMEPEQESENDALSLGSQYLQRFSSSYVHITPIQWNNSNRSETTRADRFCISAANCSSGDPATSWPEAKASTNKTALSLLPGYPTSH